MKQGDVVVSRREKIQFCIIIGILKTVLLNIKLNCHQNAIKNWENILIFPPLNQKECDKFDLSADLRLCIFFTVTQAQVQICSRSKVHCSTYYLAKTHDGGTLNTMHLRRAVCLLLVRKNMDSCQS